MEWYNNGSELKAKKSALARTTAWTLTGR